MAAGHGGSPLLRTFCAVFRTALLTVLDALGVEHAAQDMITHARQIFHAAAANHPHRVLLQIVPLTRYVADDLETIGQAHLSDLAQRRVRLLRCRRIYARANAALLRRSLQRRHSVARLEWVPRLGNQLVDCRHFVCLRYSRLGARARIVQGCQPVSFSRGLCSPTVFWAFRPGIPTRLFRAQKRNGAIRLEMRGRSSVRTTTKREST